MINPCGQERAVSWLNLFTQRLRHLLPQSIIVHSPKASYFDEEAYEKGYALFHRLIGKAVDFYNIKYYKIQYMLRKCMLYNEF